MDDAELSLLPQNTPVPYLGWIFHFFSVAKPLLKPTLNTLPHSTHIMGPAPIPRSPPGLPMPTAELCSQTGSGEQEAEQCQGPHHDADESSEADSELLTVSTARGEDGEGHAAVEGMEIWIQGGVAVWVVLPTSVSQLPARGTLRQVLAVAAVLAVALLAGGDADQSACPHIVELVTLIAI